MSDDERIEYERPTLYSAHRPILYRHDGTPLTRQIGFTMQTSGTFPELTKGGKKKGKGKRGC